MNTNDNLLIAVLVIALVVVLTAAALAARKDGTRSVVHRTILPLLALVCSAVLVGIVLLAILYGGLLLFLALVM